jgi:hypothetical protein
MSDLARRLVASLNESSDLLEEWIADEASLPPDLERQGGQVVGVLRYLSSVVDLSGRRR